MQWHEWNTPAAYLHHNIEAGELLYRGNKFLWDYLLLDAVYIDLAAVKKALLKSIWNIEIWFLKGVIVFRNDKVLIGSSDIFSW